MESRSCEFDHDCAYAHGHDELNTRKTAHKNYKTKMCKQWHQTSPGFCSYGEKCQFLHNEVPAMPQTAMPAFGINPYLSQGQPFVGLDRFVKQEKPADWHQIQKSPEVAKSIF